QMSDIHHSHHRKDGIWNTNNNEEQQRIREFWLQLGEEERQSLVKFEKKAVLKKMKEQQKHSCSYSVCG
ncbi:24221_t:CDS:1, partial [Gigaspora rosea]